MTFEIPFEYYVAVLLISVGLLHGLRSRKRSWAPGYLAVLGTVAAWYLVEPFYLPEEFAYFPPEILELGFFGVCIFLVAFMLTAPGMVRAFRPRLAFQKPQLASGWADGLSVEKVVYLVAGLWLLLLAYGTLRVGGDIFAALFPIDSRAGVRMWSRSAAGGAFLVSMASYLYILCLSIFGLLLPLTRKPQTRALLICLIVVSWPYAFLQGSRNIALAVITPFFASYLLYARSRLAMKVLVLFIGFLAVEQAMSMMIAVRNVGFGNAQFQALNDTKHLGLNMASELMHATSLLQNDTMQISFGGRYLAEIANVIPRALWPNKPLIGIDYAFARGFGGGGADIGVVATISTGMIGQGVLNFGHFVGPAFAGFLMACWVGILNRMRTHGSLPRAALFLVGLGLTFNLGRDITLLVLFPFVFGYFGVLVFEKLNKMNRRSQGKMGQAQHLDASKFRHNVAEGRHFR